MNKFKKIMLGALSVLTLGLFVVTGAKVTAATSSSTADGYTTEINSIDYTVSETNAYFTTNKTVWGSGSFTATFTSIIDGEYPKDTGHGIKMESDAYIQFTTKGTTRVQIAYGGNHATKLATVKLVKVVDSSDTNIGTSSDGGTFSTIAFADFQNLEAGTYKIVKGSNQAVVVEVKVTDVYSASVSYNKVVFYDSDKETKLGEREIETGSTTTAIENPAPSSVGQIFDKWLNVSDDSVFSESTTFDADAEFYATYKTDSNYSVTSGNLLDTNTITKIYNEAFSKQLTSTLPVTNTNFEILNGDTIQADAKTIATGIDDSEYAIRFGGNFNNAKNGLGIMTAGAGKLTIYARANAGDDATSYKGQLFTYDKDATENKYPMYLETENSADRTAVVKFEFDITEGNYYYFGNSTGAFYVYYAKFEQTSPVVALQQASNELIDNTYRLVRFIFVVDADVSLSDLTNKITLIVDGGTTNEVTATVSPLAAAKTITNNSSTYVSNGYKFSSKTNISYVVYIAKFTESTFSGHTLKAKLNYGDVDYPTSSYTFA